MITTNIHEAKTNLSKYVALAASGEQVIICKNNIPSARLVPLEEEKPKKIKPIVFGRYKGLISYNEDTFRPMTDEEIREEFGEDWA